MKLLVIDGNSIINRAYFAIRTMTTKDGMPTNAIYGFLSTLYRELDVHEPDCVLVAFDTREKTHRHLSYEGYKATRKGMPDELAMQLAPLKEVLDAMGIARFELAGYEADDIIGTLSKHCGSENSCVIVSGDKDNLQLISENVVVELPITKAGKKENIIFDEATFKDSYGFLPPQLVDLKALMGDSSDNIPGVAGVGEKTATELIQKYNTIERIYNEIDSLDIKDSVKKKLLASRELAFTSFELATIMTEVPMDRDISSYKRGAEDSQKLFDLFTKYEFNQFLKRVGASSTEIEMESSPEIIKIDDVDSLREILSQPLGELFIEISDEEIAFMGISDREKAYVASYMECGFGFGEICDLILQSENSKVFFDTKLAYTKAHELGSSVKNVLFDISLAAYVINPVGADELEKIITKYLDKPYGKGSADRCKAMLDLYKILHVKIDENNQRELYYEIELPLSYVLFDMERLGFRVDSEKLREYGERIGAEISILEEGIYELVGKFNINSPKQLGEILFVQLGLKSGKKTKSGYSTDAETLQKLVDEHDVVPLILAYRKLAKLKSTYVEGLLKLCTEDGRIHSTFNQKITQTGRISSSEPNLQNIPIREAQGRELRKFFIAKEGHVLLDADYSQIELRILAHIANDEVMIKAFKDGVDIHRVTASQVFNTALEEVDAEQRSKAKAVNFGIVYGISDFSLAQDIKVFKSEAKSYIESYFEKYANVKAYLDKTVSDAKETGEVRTIFGRIRALPEIKSSNYNVRSFGERAAMNTPIQGSAADIIKKAMVRVHARLLAEGLASKLILQVHDELLVEAPISEFEIAKRIMQEEMEGAAKLLVPLTAEVKSGENWFEAH